MKNILPYNNNKNSASFNEGDSKHDRGYCYECHGGGTCECASGVIICPQNHAEEHCLQLRSNGLLSSIEPATGGC
jgi:hypothetical protein